MKEASSRLKPGTLAEKRARKPGGNVIVSILEPASQTPRGMSTRKCIPPCQSDREGSVTCEVRLLTTSGCVTLHYTAQHKHNTTVLERGRATRRARNARNAAAQNYRVVAQTDSSSRARASVGGGGRCDGHRVTQRTELHCVQCEPTQAEHGRVCTGAAKDATELRTRPTSAAAGGVLRDKA
jgi:hypothetical protein